ncbi:MAG: Transketolase domain protein [Microvirga sp.]|nr:Transketolase domain protein [Microvirga sp.]
MRQLRYAQSINEGLRQLMTEDPDIFIIGEDIRHAMRGLTRGLASEFGRHRVVDMPISEAAFTGLATGAAMSGMRPIIEYQIGALAFVAFDQLVDQAMKLPYMMGGQCKVPVTYIFPASGFRTGLAGQHSDQLYTYLMQAGMKVVIPSNPSDAKGLLVSAVRCDDPVAYFAPAALMPTRGPVPEELFEVPLGRGEVRREGDTMSVIATGHLVGDALRVADELAPHGISLHVYDPRTLLPLDMEGLEAAVRRTGRVIVFDDSNRICGFGAEIAAVIAEHWFDVLKAPVKRIGRATVPVPFSPFLDKAVVPTSDTLKQVVLELHKRQLLQAT